MKPRTTLLIALILTLTAKGIDAQGPATMSLQGVVLQEGTELPIGKATIELRDASYNGLIAGRTMTLQDGRFVLQNLRPGRYKLTVLRPGFVRTEVGALNLIAGVAHPSVPIAMKQTGTLTGRVTANGEPLVLADVFALKATYVSGQRVLTVAQSAKTNLEGEYRLFWLSPGPYYVAAVATSPDAYGVSTLVLNQNALDTSLFSERLTLRSVLSGAIGNGVGEDAAHVPSYYPGTPDAQAARVVDLSAGAEVRGINIDAPPRKTYRVSGPIGGDPLPIGSTGQTIRPAVTLYSAGIQLSGSPTADATNQLTAEIDRDGRFVFPKVVPGMYILQATAGVIFGRSRIEVVDRDLNVGIDLKAGYTFVGHIVIEGANAGLISLRVILRSEPFLPPQYSTAVQADGKFTIPGIAAGRYRVFVTPILASSSSGGTPPLRVPSALEKAYVKSIRLGNRDVLNDGIEIDAGLEGDLEIVIGTKPGSLEGVVLDKDLQPIGNATVVLLPENALRYRIDHLAVPTDQSGRFEFPNVTPGDYKVLAWVEVDRISWQNPDFVNAVESLGPSVRIEESGKTKVELTAIPRTQ
jgi:hypothetical protein